MLKLTIKYGWPKVYAYHADAEYRVCLSLYSFDRYFWMNQDKAWNRSMWVRSPYVEKLSVFSNLDTCNMWSVNIIPYMSSIGHGNMKFLGWQTGNPSPSVFKSIQIKWSTNSKTLGIFCERTILTYILFTTEYIISWIIFFFKHIVLQWVMRIRVQYFRFQYSKYVELLHWICLGPSDINQK